MRVRINLLLLAGFLAAAMVPPAWGQTPAARLITAARLQLDELNSDSAAALLRQALDQQVAATPAERVAVLSLLGVTELIEGREPRARDYFRQVLQIDPEAAVDTLQDLHSDLLRVFAGEKERVLRLSVAVPMDTVVPIQAGALRVGARTSRTAVVELRVASSAGVTLRHDTLASGRDAWEWSLRSADGTVVPPGTYTLIVSARDPAGSEARPVTWSLSVERLAADTVALPPPLPATAFAPESVTRRQRQTGALVRGLAFGAVAVFLAVEGPGKSGGDAKGYVVGGALSGAGLLGFLSGKIETRPIPDNIQRNQQLRQQDAERRAAIVAANARARQEARLRVRSASSER